MVPIDRPGKIICVGLNYKDHAEEQGVDLPKAPLFFAKYTTSLIGPGDPIVIPFGVDRDKIEYYRKQVEEAMLAATQRAEELATGLKKPKLHAVLPFQDIVPAAVQVG